MHIKAEKRLGIVETLPGFSSELRQLLIEEGESELASQVPNLAILERCRCGDRICGTFYTKHKPERSFGQGHRNVRLMPEEGMLILDVVAGEISCVEVLDRRDVREKLDEVLP